MGPKQFAVVPWNLLHCKIYLKTSYAKILMFQEVQNNSNKVNWINIRKL